MTRSPPTSLYDEDFFAWTQEQAAALRGIAIDAFGEDIDIEHLAEEIEDLGKRDLREVKSYIARLFEHLFKIKATPGSLDVPHWQSEALFFHDAAAEEFSASMRRLLDIDAIWRKTVRRGETLFAARGLRISPRSCPFQLDDVLSGDFDITAALDRFDVT